LHRAQICHHGRGSGSSIESLGVEPLGPGKRTLTEGLTIQRRAAEVVSGAEPAAGQSAAPQAPAGGEARPTLEQLFGRAHGSTGDARSTGDRPLPADGGGQAMPAAVRARMESAFGADFSQVRIHEGPRAEALGARAYTQGADIHFSPGAYQPHSTAGQELLGHELTHVVQQRQGRVQATTQAKGIDVNDDSALEREADRMGAQAARGEAAGAAPSAPPASMTGTADAAPVQRVPIGPGHLETTDRNNRPAVLDYLRRADTNELSDILQRMLMENHANNNEYVQIAHKELMRSHSLAHINETARQNHGVWTRGTVFYEKAACFWTAPARAGDHGDTDPYGVGEDNSHEAAASVKDSEVSTIAQLERYLANKLHDHDTGKHHGQRVEILITGNLGPCDGCKDRLERFIAECRRRWLGVNFALEVNYTTQPNDVQRQGLDTTYGHHRDGFDTAASGMRYYHHQF
jgi:hypothetical protein